MSVIRRLTPYFRPLWRTIVLGLVLMACYALFSGFSIGLILPIVDKVFMRAESPSGPTVHVDEGLHQAWSDAGEAFRSAEGFTHRFEAARDAAVAGLKRIQEQAPPLEILAWLCVISLVAIFLKNAADYGRKVSFIRVEQRAAESLRTDLFHRVVLFPLSTFNRIPSGQILSRLVTDVELVKQFTINSAANFVHNLLQVIVYLGISVWASYRLALVSFLIVPPVAFITGKIASKLRRHSGRAQARIAEVTSSLAEVLGGIRIVKAFGSEAQEQHRFAGAIARYRRSVIRLMGLDALAAPLSEFWGVAIGVTVLYYGGRLVLTPDSGMTAGRFFVFFIALVSMLHPLKELANVVTRFQRGAAAADRVFEVLDLAVEEDSPDAAPLPGFEKDLAFEGVDFAYEKDRPVLRDVSFTARAGTTTALVGPSGGGKSTLVDLIPRFHDPTAGRVLVDGKDLRRVRRRDLRALIGIVTQETLLFNDTVFNNIAYGVEAPSRERVIEAARAANAHEFIEAMPSGYDTVIGERGVLLSGGQRQRLAIARAVLRNPAILILDEATSSLDTESENLVQEALERLLSGRTTFVIAHRLSTVMRADRILVLDRGRIVQSGTHAELVAAPGLYRRLYTLQFRDEEIPRLDAVES
jgi:subfamily B ATP-binding cassette protein MsbA